MCGILGSPQFTPQVRRMLPYLALGMEHRGHHSWGASDGTTVIKNLGLITRTWYKELPVVDQWTQGIFHTRAASPGYSPSEVNNAHPFRYTKPDGTDVIGIHNGALNNHEELNRKYQRSCTVDSQHLWMHRAESRPWLELRGAGIMVWWETLAEYGPDPVMLATKINGQALEIVQVDDGGFVFASTMEAIQLAAAMAGATIKTAYRTDSNRVYHLAADAVYKTEEFVHFGVAPTYAGPASYPVKKAGYPECCKCRASVDNVEHLYCPRCFAELVSDYNTWFAQTGGKDIHGDDVDTTDTEPDLDPIPSAVATGCAC